MKDTDTMIRVKKKTRDRLRLLIRFNDSYDIVINGLLDQVGDSNEE